MRYTALKLALYMAIEIAGTLVGDQGVYAQQTTDQRVSDLVRAGKVRVGIGVVAPHWAVKDAATGELRGVAIDIARKLVEVNSYEAWVASRDSI